MRDGRLQRRVPERQRRRVRAPQQPLAEPRHGGRVRRGGEAGGGDAGGGEAGGARAARLRLGDRRQRDRVVRRVRPGEVAGEREGGRALLVLGRVRGGGGGGGHVRAPQRDVGQGGRGEEQLGGAGARLLLLADGHGGAGRAAAGRGAPRRPALAVWTHLHIYVTTPSTLSETSK